MQSSGIRAAHRGGAEYAEPFDTLRVSGFPPLMVSLSNHANSAVVRKNSRSPFDGLRTNG